MSDEDFSLPPTHGQLSLGPARVQEEMKMREREGRKQHLSRAIGSGGLILVLPHQFCFYHVTSVGRYWLKPARDTWETSEVEKGA